MKTKNIFSAILMAMLVLVSSVSFTACDGEDQLDTNQFTQPVSLLAFGPSPVARGGELRIVGTGLDKVSSVTLPGCGDVNDINHVSSEEIRITVPMNAQPGKIAINAAGQIIESKTVISYTEPVGFSQTGALTPNTIKPGQVLAIKGSYLNLVQTVVFAEDVEVSELVFKGSENHESDVIEVVVPAEAQTGKVAIAFCATGDTIPNTIYSSDELAVVLPSVKEAMNLTGKKPGDEVKIAVENIDLVTRVTVAGNDVEFKVAEGNLVFCLPAETPAEAVVAMYPASGIQIEIAYIGMQVPTNLVATPATGLRAGDKIVISGKDLDVVSTVSFPGVEEAVAPASQSATELTVVCPEGFVSGDLILTCKSGAEQKVAIETLKPVFASFEAAEVSIGSNVTILGENLDLVVKVLYSGAGEGEVVEAEPTKLVVTMPALGPETGVVTMVMANGETVDTESLTINAPVFCNVIGWPELPEGELIQAGSVMVVTIANADHLTGVEVNGEPVQFIVNGDQLYFNTPYAASMNSKIKLISDNGEIEYDYQFKPNTEIVTVIWSGVAELGWSGDGQVYLGDDGGQSLIAAGAKAGDILRIKLQPTADDWQVQIWEGHWGGMYDEIKADNYDLAGNNYYYNIVLTDDLLATFTTQQWWGGIVLVQGQSCVVTALELFQKVSMETVIWKGEAVADDWGGQPGFFADGGAELIEAGMKVGSIIRFYITPMEENWNLQVTEGHWGPKYNDLNQDNYDLAAHNGAIELEITQEIYDAAITVQWWGNVFLLNGDNVICTKITLE